MFLLIDNYDSFTYNLWHFLGQLGADVQVKRNDKISVRDALKLEPDGIIISPGPCDPQKAGISLDLINAAPHDLPIFGVCLGHQCIAQAFGARIIRAPEPMHGKLSTIHHHNNGLFNDLPNEFTATRYHSLIVEKSSVPSCLKITAETNDGTIMALSHEKRPIHGVQFHPESIASEHGYFLISNFLKSANLKTLPSSTLNSLQNILRKGNP